MGFRTPPSSYEVPPPPASNRHDRITDSLVNFETVKYFANEKYEKKRFGDAVGTYQKESVSVQVNRSSCY
jgi:ABC-type transport system involved in Fe-S cluster assembly fused permease/ATPase subunit